MRGQDTLIALRRRGIRPAKGVLLEVSEHNCGNSAYQPHLDDGSVCLWCKPGERNLDLRCVIGLKVVVYGARDEVTPDDLRAVAEQCIASGATRVVAIEYGDVLCRDVYPEIGEWRERGSDG